MARWSPDRTSCERGHPWPESRNRGGSCQPCAIIRQQARRKHGLSFRPSVIERFLASTQKTEACWLWQGYLSPKGYGHMWVDSRTVGIHRLAYMLFVGPVPDGLEIDHLCKVRHCVNPTHLEAVPHSLNASRGTHFGVKHPNATGDLNWRRRKTHCVHGHPWDEANTRWTPGGTRDCRTCRARISREAEARRPQRDWAGERRRRKAAVHGTLGVGAFPK